jgi:hypothetical protein
MFKLCVKSLSPIALVLTMFCVGHASTIYMESVNGDLSNDGLNPTSINVSAGSNMIFGTTGGNTAPNVRDYFTIFVPANLQLVALIEQAGTQAGNLGFLGLQSGTQVTLATNTMTAAGLLGWVHYAPTATDINLLATMAIPANGSSGFTPPLGSGSYAFWLQDTSPGTFEYAFNIVLEPIPAPVPEPATLALTLVGLALLPLLRRRSS